MRASIFLGLVSATGVTPGLSQFLAQKTRTDDGSFSFGSMTSWIHGDDGMVHKELHEFSDKTLDGLRTRTVKACADGDCQGTKTVDRIVPELALGQRSIDGVEVIVVDLAELSPSDQKQGPLLPTDLQHQGKPVFTAHLGGTDGGVVFEAGVDANALLGGLADLAHGLFSELLESSEGIREGGTAQEDASVPDAGPCEPMEEALPPAVPTSEDAGPDESRSVPWPAFPTEQQEPTEEALPPAVPTSEDAESDESRSVPWPALPTEQQAAWPVAVV